MLLSTSPFNTAKGLLGFSALLDTAIHKLCSAGKYGLILNPQKSSNCDVLESWPAGEFVYGRYKRVTSGSTVPTDFWVGLEFTGNDVFIFLWFSIAGAGHSQPLSSVQYSRLTAHANWQYAVGPLKNRTDIWLRMNPASIQQYAQGAVNILEYFIDEILSSI
jgi:hypothetical protein